MEKYVCLYNREYEQKLVAGKVYSGKETQGIFAGRPFLVVFDEKGEKIATTHLSRFEKVI